MSYATDRRFGFIRQEGGGPNLYFPNWAVVDDIPIRKGMRVTYDIETPPPYHDNPSRLRAIDVRPWLPTVQEVNHDEPAAPFRHDAFAALPLRLEGHDVPDAGVGSEDDASSMISTSSI